MKSGVVPQQSRLDLLERTLLELGGEDLQFGDEEAEIVIGHRFGGGDQRFEHHRDARQDRLLDPLERLVKAGLLFAHWHMRQYGANAVKVW